MARDNDSTPRWSLRIIPDREDPSQEVWIFDERPTMSINEHPPMVLFEAKLNGNKQSVGVRLDAILTWSIESMADSRNEMDSKPELNTAMAEVVAEDFYEK